MWGLTGVQVLAGGLEPAGDTPPFPISFYYFCLSVIRLMSECGAKVGDQVLGGCLEADGDTPPFPHSFYLC